MTLTRERLDAIRAMYADYERAYRAGVVEGSYDALHIEALVCSLLASVPVLLDEIDRLRDRRPEVRAVPLKRDRWGGHA